MTSIVNYNLKLLGAQTKSIRKIFGRFPYTYILYNFRNYGAAFLLFFLLFLLNVEIMVLKNKIKYKLKRKKLPCKVYLFPEY